MADIPSNAHSGAGPAFLSQARLDYFIPLATDFPLSDLSAHKHTSFDQVLESIERRESLFFDESVHVVLLLKTPHVQDDVLRSSLKRLVVSLNAQIINGSTPDRDNQPASEVIFSGTVEDYEEPKILVEPLAEDNESTHEDERERSAYVVWKIPIFLSRPRIRLQKPSVIFAATADLKPVDVSLSDGPRDGYLLSGVPSGLNLLETFSKDPAMNGAQPRLSALRVSRVAPMTQQAKDLLRSIKSLSKLSLRIYPAVHSRVRFTHPNTAPSTAAVIAMLELDFTPFFECEIILDSISLSVPDGIIQDLMSQSGLSLPLSCVAHDHVTFLYRIAPIEADVMSRNPMRDLDITISATALIRPGVCSPRLIMAWTATVDFTAPLNPGYGSAMQPIQRAHRPSQLSIGGDTMVSLAAPSVTRPDALPFLGASPTRTETTAPELGVTMTFIAPPPAQKIHVGREFVWSVFVVNRASNVSQTPRKLALVVVPKRRRNESRVLRPPSMSRSAEAVRDPSHPQPPKDRTVADAVIDENVVYAMQRSSVVDNAQVVCLSADVRIGPLAPGACHVAELKFLALKEGAVTIEAIRVVDLGSNEHVDIRDLPTIIVEGKQDVG